MNPTYAVYTHIDRPVDEVFQAFKRRDVFSKIFTPTSGDLEQDAVLTWAMSHSDVTVKVASVIESQRIEILFYPAEFVVEEMRAGDRRDYEARIVVLFEAADAGGTLVTLCEYGWQSDKRSILQSYGHCSGWQTTLLCFKALLLYDIDLSTPPEVRPDYSRLWGPEAA